MRLTGNVTGSFLPFSSCGVSAQLGLPIQLTIRKLDKGVVVRVRSIRQYDVGRYASENVNKLLVGNKCDLEPKRAVSTEQAKVSSLPLDNRANFFNARTHIAGNLYGSVRTRVWDTMELEQCALRVSPFQHIDRQCHCRCVCRSLRIAWALRSWRRVPRTRPMWRRLSSQWPPRSRPGASLAPPSGHILLISSVQALS